MFGNCPPLKTVNIANGVTDIKAQSFVGAFSVHYLLIPNSVEFIGSLISTNESLTIDLSMYSDSENIPLLENSNAFPVIAKKLVRNQSMLNAFEATTNWSTYAGSYQIGGEYAE